MPHKLYIDSRNRIRGSASDFFYQIPIPIHIQASRAFIDSVSLPNVFPTLHGNNNAVYLEEINSSNVSTKRKIFLRNGFYDGEALALELKTLLNTQISLSQLYEVTFEEKLGKIKITNPSPSPEQFFIWPEAYLERGGLWNPLNLNTIPPFIKDDNAYGVLGIYGDQPLAGPVTSSGHISVMPYHTLFIHSDLGLQDDSIGPNGEKSIIRKVTIDQGSGSMIHDFHSLPYDYVTVPKGQIRTMHFKITDYLGREVDMSHMSISFSILFIDENEFR